MLLTGQLSFSQMSALCLHLSFGDRGQQVKYTPGDAAASRPVSLDVTDIDLEESDTVTDEAESKEPLPSPTPNRARKIDLVLKVGLLSDTPSYLEGLLEKEIAGLNLRVQIHSVWGVKGRNIQCCLLQHSKEDFIPGGGGGWEMGVLIGTGTTAVGFCSEGERLGQWELTAKEQGRGSVDGKLLRGNIRGEGRFWLNQPSGIFAEGRPG